MRLMFSLFFLASLLIAEKSSTVQIEDQKFKVIQRDYKNTYKKEEEKFIIEDFSAGKRVRKDDRKFNITTLVKKKISLKKGMKAALAHYAKTCYAARFSFINIESQAFRKNIKNYNNNFLDAVIICTNIKSKKLKNYEVKSYYTPPKKKLVP